MGKRNVVIFALAVLLAVPFSGMALTTINVPNVNTSLTLTGLIDVIFNFLWPIIAVVLVVVLIGVAFLFITAQGDPAKIAQARLGLIGAAVVIVLVLLSFSIPFVIKNSLGL